ncbi:MAG TPA: hypothetical protein VGX21_09100 [Methylomirabilota bacterium]|jgi:hypothetical protein|nr:hypothetical protein [Methylomirabilota bacterium]
MAEDWAKTIAKKVESRIAEEADKTATLRKRFEDGIQRFRKQVLDLVASVNSNIATEPNRIQTILLDNGIVMAAAYKRMMTVEEIGVTPGVPACVGKVVIQRENRKAAAPTEPEEIYLTSAGTQTAFYHYVGKDLKIMSDAEFRQIVEYFAS